MIRMLLIIIAWILMGAALAQAGDYLVMDRANLEAGQKVLAQFGHQVLPFDGVALGSDEARAEGTARIFIRARNDRGEWLGFVVEATKGMVSRIHIYQIKPPKDFTEDK